MEANNDLLVVLLLLLLVVVVAAMSALPVIAESRDAAVAVAVGDGLKDGAMRHAFKVG